MTSTDPGGGGAPPPPAPTTNPNYVPPSGWQIPQPYSNPAALSQVQWQQVNTPAYRPQAVPDAASSGVAGYINAHQAAGPAWLGSAPAPSIYGQPHTGSGGGAAAPAAYQRPPQPNNSWWLPDGDGIHGHWVSKGPDAGATPAATTPLPGAQNFNPVFYAPTTQSPYLTMQDNFLSYLDPTVRQQLQQQLEHMGFQATGDIGQYGEQMYLRPPQFNNADLNQITDPGIRQWLKFFLGQLGYGISYQLPTTPTTQGTPPAPPDPNTGAFTTPPPHPGLPG